jgi:hypothetical protein
MEFAPEGGRWAIAKSGHAALPRLVLDKLPGLPAD